MLFEGFKEFWGHVYEMVTGKDNEVLIQGVTSVVVRVAAKHISFIGFTRFVAELKVVLLKFNLPGGGAGSHLMGLTPVHEVLVISPDDNRLIQGSGVEEMEPMTEGTDNSKKFSIVNFVIHFSRNQGLGIVSAGMQFLRHGRVLLP